MALHEGTTSFGMEVSVYACPPKIQPELEDVLPGAPLESLLIIPTCQRATMDLVQTGEDVEKEKDRLLEQFMEWAKKLCEALQAQGHWSDYIDPCSGLPMIHQDNHSRVYSEVEALSVLKGYKTANAGCCKVLLHPQWGSAVYPASMFTSAPPDVLMAAMKQVDVVS